MASKKDRIYIGSKLSGLVNEMTADCNSEKTCSNTDLDETMCTLPDNEDKMFKCRGTSRSTSSIPMSAVCDLKCDCYLCDDEAKCNNVTYGMFCNTVKGGYVHARYICDKKRHCLDYKDERRCKPVIYCNVIFINHSYILAPSLGFKVLSITCLVELKNS